MSFDHHYWRRGSRTLILIGVCGFLARYALDIGLARLLSVADYGDYRVALAFVNLSALAVLLGGDRAAGRYLPPWIRNEDGLGVWEYVRFYLAVAFMLSLLVIVVTVGVAYLSYGPVDPEDYHPLVWASLALPVMALSIMIGRVFQAGKHPALASTPYRLAFPLTKLGLVIAVSAWVGHVTDIGAIGIFMVAAILIVFYQLYEVSRRDLMPLRRARNLATPRSWLNTSMPMLVAILLQGGLARMDIFMLEMLGHEASVGLFGAAATVVTLLTMFQQAVLGLVNPLVRPALSEGSGSMREIQARGFRLLVMLIFPASIALLVFGEPILRLFGPSYPQAYAALMILVVGRMISTQLSLTNMWLRFSGGARLIARVMLFALVFNVALNLVLVPSYGMTGAATATASALIGSSVFLSVSMHRRLGISPWPFHALVSGWRRNERV